MQFASFSCSIGAGAGISTVGAAIGTGGELTGIGELSTELLCRCLGLKGRVLVWHDFRGDVSVVQAERFFTKFLEKEGMDP